MILEVDPPRRRWSATFLDAAKYGREGLVVILMPANLIVIAVPDRFQVGAPRDIRGVQLTPDSHQLGDSARNFLFSALPAANGAGGHAQKSSRVVLLEAQDPKVFVEFFIGHAPAIEEQGSAVKRDHSPEAERTSGVRLRLVCSSLALPRSHSEG